MSAGAAEDWAGANQRYLTAALALVREALERRASSEPERTDARPGEDPARRSLRQAEAEMPAPAALDRLCTAFGLSPFERDVLLLCAGVELDSSFASLCAAAQGDPARPYPTFSLALAALPEPHWSALTPASPLRRWRLIEVGAGGALTTGPLRIDERVLHHLAGVQHLDERLVGFVDVPREPGELAPSHRQLAERLAALWSQSGGGPVLPAVQLCGDDVYGKRAIATAACADLGLELRAMSALVVPTGPGELDALIRLWEREAALSAGALLLECDEVDQADAARESAVARLIESTNGPLVVASRVRRRVRWRPLIALDVPVLTAGEQRAIWQRALGAAASNLNGTIEALVSQFSLSAPIIHAASAEALGRLGSSPRRGRRRGTQEAELLGGVLWDACRAQARPRLDDLAQRIEPAAVWADLILPDAQRQTLGEVAAHARQRALVYETWGFAARGARGLGISVLFTGPSGTGKTMAAEVLANELRLDLYRIDLSQVVSKYIGETEKNLRQVFDAAEEGGAILLFDEADALFGKRSEVKDSHDRYANIEVSYLLQRMEAYRGLAILTTDMKSALDPAFLRRIRFVVQFPFPDAEQRAEIWRRIFPPQTPTEDLDLSRLARLNMAGGNIRNIALNAAFLAADAGESVRMTHLLRAARSEYAKLEKPLTAAEIGGWA